MPSPLPPTLHATAVARDGLGVLLLGPSGAGKSDLALRLIRLGFVLIADDRVVIEGGVARPPPALAGLLEVRGLGIVRLAHAVAPLRLAVTLLPPGARPPRLPAPARFRPPGYPDLDLPEFSVEAGAPSAPERVALALDIVTGRIPMQAGAFA